MEAEVKVNKSQEGESLTFEWLISKMLKFILRDIRDYVRLKKHQENWIKIRGNNYTVAGNRFPVSCVTVGDYTYGTLNIHYYNQPEEKLEIGRYCSIANNVQFFTGGGMTLTI